MGSVPRERLVVEAVKDGAKLDHPLRVAVVGGGPAGACCAETLAQNGIETYLFERKLDNCKVHFFAFSVFAFLSFCLLHFAFLSLSFVFLYLYFEICEFMFFVFSLVVVRFQFV